MNKKELREHCRNIIKATPQEKFALWGKKMLLQILQTEHWKAASTVFIYVSLPSEADTSKIILEALKGGKRLCVPKITGNGTMEAVQIESIAQLQKGKFGILEPIDGCKIIQKNEIDLAIMPCMAADENGNRLGKGGGFYDRFCENFSQNALILCPEALLFKEIPTESWDSAADVVTEDRILKKKSAKK